jgi:hypothetical protein
MEEKRIWGSLASKTAANSVLLSASGGRPRRAQERNDGADQASARVEDHTHRAATATELKRESFSGAIARPAGEASAPCFNSLTSLGARQMLSSS